MYKGINDFKNGYQHRTKRVKNDGGDWFVDFHRNLGRWGNSFFEPFNVQRVPFIDLIPGK